MSPPASQSSSVVNSISPEMHVNSYACLSTDFRSSELSLWNLYLYDDDHRKSSFNPGIRELTVSRGSSNYLSRNESLNWSNIVEEVFLEKKQERNYVPKSRYLKTKIIKRKLISNDT